MLQTVINPVTLFRNAAFGSRSTSSRLALSSLHRGRTNFDGTQTVNGNFSGGELSKILLSSEMGNFVRNYSSAGLTSAAKISPAVNFLDMVKDGSKTLNINDVLCSAKRNKGWYSFSIPDSNVKILASASRLGTTLLEKRSFWKRAAVGLGHKISGTVFGARSKKIQALGGIFILLAMSETPDAETAILAGSSDDGFGKNFKKIYIKMPEVSPGSLTGVESSRKKRIPAWYFILMSAIVGFVAGCVISNIVYSFLFSPGLSFIASILCVHFLIIALCDGEERIVLSDTIITGQNKYKQENNEPLLSG